MLLRKIFAFCTDGRLLKKKVENLSALHFYSLLGWGRFLDGAELMLKVEVGEGKRMRKQEQCLDSTAAGAFEKSSNATAMSS